MNRFLLEMVAPVIVRVINELLTPENLQVYGDKLFDFIEDAVEASETTLDDKVVLPVVKTLRVTLNVPDRD